MTLAHTTTHGPPAPHVWQVSNTSPTGRQLLRTFEHDVTQAQFSVIAELPADDQALIIRAIDLMVGAEAAREPAAPGRPGVGDRVRGDGRGQR